MVNVLIIGPFLGILLVSPILVPGLLIWAIRKVRADRRVTDATARWRQTSGRIIVSEVHRSPSSGRRTEDTGWPQARIEYTYQLGPDEYRGTQVALVPLARKDARAHLHAVQRYRPGQSVTVYYDPSSPLRSALELTGNPPDADSLAWLSLLAAVAALMGAVGVLAYRLANP